MKLTFAQEDTVRSVASRLRGLSRTRPSFQRARAQLSHAMADALTTSFEALSDLRSGGVEAARTQQRLRDVVERDRALRAVVVDEKPKALPTSSSRRDELVADEPIRTRTMARLLSAQGYRKRALAIYDELLTRHPEDTVLREEAQAVRAG
jgi:hypothetical protein